MSSKLKIKTGLLLVILANTVFANTNSIITTQQERGVEIVKNFTGKFDDLKKDSGKKTQKYQTYIDKLGANTKTLAPQFSRSTPRAIIFVSFSMPNLLLQQIIKQASFYHIPVVIRGLYRDSFRATVNKIFNLVKKDNQGGVLIDPIWFRKFNIKAVPAFVAQEDNNFDVVYGNIPVKRALEIIADRGSTASMAQQILEDNKNA